MIKTTVGCSLLKDGLKIDRSFSITKNRFKEILDDSGVTKGTMATQTGLSPSTINTLYFNPWSCPSSRSLSLICLYFGVEPSDLIYVPDVIRQKFLDEGLKAAEKLAKKLEEQDIKEYARSKRVIVIKLDKE